MSDNNPLIVDTGRGLSVNYRSRFLYSKYSPQKGVDRYLKEIEFTNNTIYFVPSPLLGYGIDHLKKNLPKTSKIIFIEIDPLLYEISTKNIDLTLIQNGFDFVNLLSNINFSTYKKCTLVNLNGSYDLYKKEYDRLFNILLNQLHNFWKNRYTLTQMGHLWVKNSLINLKSLDYAEPFSNLKTNKPVVIIGAGESTESILNLLKEFRESIFILCVDTALQILLEVNITPDVVLALEAQYYNLPDFYGAKNKNIDLIYDLSSYPAVPRTIKGKKYYTITKYSDSVLLKKINKELQTEFIPPMGSVGITALYLGFKITNSPIFLAGLDFSYTKGKSHSRGTPYHLTTLTTWTRTKSGDSYIQSLKRPLIEKKNKIGIMENSDKILYEYSLHAKELLYGNKRVFDLTKRGMDLGAEVIDREIFINLITNTPTNYSPIFKLEFDNISEAIKQIKKTINGEIEIKQLIPYLRKVKYIFEHYPETEPLDLLSISNINRYYYTLLRFMKMLK